MSNMASTMKRSDLVNALRDAEAIVNQVFFDTDPLRVPLRVPAFERILHELLTYDVELEND